MTHRKSAILLVAAQVIGQLSLLVAIPLLTRTFEASDIGRYQLANALALMLQPLASLRVEFIIPVSSGTESISRLVRLARGGTAVTVLLALSASVTFAMTGHRGGASVLAMTAVLLTTYAWIAVENALLIRDERYGRLATRNLVGGVFAGGLQIAVAVLFPHIVVIALAMFVGRLPVVWLTRAKSEGVRPQGPSEIPYGWRRVATTVTSGLLSNTILQALTLLASFGFGSSAAGYVGTAQRLAGTPVGLVSQGLGQIVQGTLAGIIASGRPVLATRVRHLASWLLIAAVLLSGAMATLGPLLAEPLLGPEWAIVGAILALLAAPVALQLVVSPLNPLLVMAGRERGLLLMQVSRLIASVGGAAVTALLSRDLLATVGVFAGMTAVAYGANLLFLLRVAKQWDAARAAGRPGVVAANAGRLVANRD